MGALARSRRATLAATIGLAVLAVVWLAACSPKKVLVPPLSPETTVFVQGTLDTVSYHAHLYWFGSDSDGFVTGFEVRFLNPDQPADSGWVFTTRTDSLFDVYTPTGVSSPVFQVRAVDNTGLIDPTPAEQLFRFENKPPRVFIISGPATRDTTFASVTISWVASDPDGDVRNAKYQVWLDGNQATPNQVTATTFTVPTDQFRRSGALVSEARKIYVRAIDEGGYATAPESLSWFVRAPVTGTRARLLIVDDMPGNTGAASRNDTLYTEPARRNLPADSWSVLRVAEGGSGWSAPPFRSTADLEQTFKLFETVLWYRGSEVTMQPLLTNYRDGLAAYLESGGKFFIETQHVLAGDGASGIFPEEWVTRYFGSDRLYLHGTSVVGDSSAAWGISSLNGAGQPNDVRSSVFGVVLRQQQTYNSLRAFAVRDTDDVALWADPGSLSERNTFPMPIAVSVPQPKGGRLVAVTIPLRNANGLLNVYLFVGNVFQQLGLTGP